MVAGLGANRRQPSQTVAVVWQPAKTDAKIAITKAPRFIVNSLPCALGFEPSPHVFRLDLPLAVQPSGIIRTTEARDHQRQANRARDNSPP